MLCGTTHIFFKLVLGSLNGTDTHHTVIKKAFGDYLFFLYPVNFFFHFLIRLP